MPQIANRFQIEGKLQKMIGKSFMYKLKVRKIIDFKILDNENEILISTDSGLVSFKADKAMEEISLFLPAESEGKSLVPFGGDKNWNTLKETVYGVIEKLNSPGGEKYVEQAKTINESAKTLVEMLKVEVDVAKVLQGSK
jgi:hypothetical protein